MSHILDACYTWCIRMSYSVEEDWHSAIQRIVSKYQYMQ